MTSRTALIVRGGWDGHHPVETTEMFLPFLRSNGFEVRIEESPRIYTDADVMSGVDLVVQAVTMSEADAESVEGLRAAVAAGTGLAGWHGGIVDSYRHDAAYLQLVGGQFAAHPGKTRATASIRRPTPSSSTVSRSPTSGERTRSRAGSTTSPSSPSSTGCCTTT